MGFFRRRRGYLSSLVILRGRAGYELIYITNEAVGRVGYYKSAHIQLSIIYQLISGYHSWI